MPAASKINNAIDQWFAERVANGGPLARDVTIYNYTFGIVTELKARIAALPEDAPEAPPPAAVVPVDQLGILPSAPAPEPEQNIVEDQHPVVEQSHDTADGA